ncbi:MAG: DUF1501 domain-containing protein [Saprospiraceae bacterium]|nr:DUF1501 domain-containing protein [Saprospiraceae bacterium]
MKRRKFFSVTGTFTGGALVLPEFLQILNAQVGESNAEQCLVFIQLNGGNDGLNTFIPYVDPLYYQLRPNIALGKDKVIGHHNGMAFHPALPGFAEIQQHGNLSIIQNVGYPEPDRSHFRSQEIWQTASSASQYLSEGWLGRFLDLQCRDHNPVAGVNLDLTDNLALRGLQPNSITVKDPRRFKTRNSDERRVQLSDNPQLDFVRKIANSIETGSAEIQAALARSTSREDYPQTGLGRKLEWISQLIKGGLGSQIFYTSLNGFDTHDNQLALHQRFLTELNDAVFSFYQDLRNADLLKSTSIVIFSEFGRRVADNGKGTDHGAAAPMFVIGGETKGKIIGSNPNLSDLDRGDLKYQIDFRSVYGSLIKNKFNFDPIEIGINNEPLPGLF